MGVKTYKEIVRELIGLLEETIELDAFNEADMSDIGNEIGYALGKHFSEKRFGFERNTFEHGFNHGIANSIKNKRKNGNNGNNGNNKGNDKKKTGVHKDSK